MAWGKAPGRELLLPVHAYNAVCDCCRKVFCKFHMSAARASESEGTKMGREARATARRLYGQLTMSE
eukprot:7606994-Lingulodinium_polyedra.AAC.1